MKVLFLVNNPYNSLNPYTSTIIEGLKKLDKKIHIDWGIDKLWNETAFTFDIIHIMWPHLLLVNGRYTSEDLKNRLEQLKTSNIKIVSTCHNLKPHYSNNAETIKAYDIAYKESNIILHLGKYSLDFFKQEYPDVENLLIFHHIYEDRYKIRYDKFTAQKKLNLKPNKEYILCFGAFRNAEERKLLLYVLNNLSHNVRLIAPQFCGVNKRSNISYILKYLFYRIRHPQIIMHFGAIKDQDLPIYFSASDVVLIQRTQILNSGNLPLGFYMGKVVIGPNIGNVGTILTETGNPTFDVSDYKSIINAIKQSFILSKEEKGTYNQQYAMRNFSLNIVCKLIYDCYNKLLTK